MRALHIPSNTEAEVIGYHRQRRAHLIKLTNGTTQMWCNNYKILGDPDMTKKIMMTISGGSHGKMYEVIDRVFENVEEAQQYFAQLTELNNIKTIDEDKGMHATLTNGWTVACNYDMRKILKLKPVKEELSEIYPFELRKAVKRFTMPTKRSNLNDDVPDLLSTAISTPKKKLTGKVIHLKDITKDARKARSILRQLVRQKKITKPGRWEWEEGSKDLEVVRKALGK